jgi:hypothetical protein
MSADDYYSADFPEGISKEQIKELDPSEKVDLMRAWFFQNYEDPANETPHESESGGYQFVWGGPYDARDELFDEFGDFIDEKLIEELIEEVEEGGITDWAPTSRNQVIFSPDEEIVDGDSQWPPILAAEDKILKYENVLENGFKPPLNFPGEVEERQEAIKKLRELQEGLSKVNQQPSMMGHNNPPGPVEPITINIHIEKIEYQLEKAPSPDVKEVLKSTKSIRDFVIGLAAWLAKKADQIATATIGYEIKGYLEKNPDAAKDLYIKALAAYEALMHWFQVIF